jgi:hypothetical protein
MFDCEQRLWESGQGRQDIVSSLLQARCVISIELSSSFVIQIQFLPPFVAKHARRREVKMGAEVAAVCPVFAKSNATNRVTSSNATVLFFLAVCWRFDDIRQWRGNQHLKFEL